jgi:hypothetical protein
LIIEILMNFMYIHVKWTEEPGKSYRASGRLIVNSLLEYIVDVLWKATKLLDLWRLRLENAGSFGEGSDALSLLNIWTTNGIVGLSAGDSWTHKSPTWMHLKILSGLSHESFIDGSIRSSPLASFHNSHAWEAF